MHFNTFVMNKLHRYMSSHLIEHIGKYVKLEKEEKELILKHTINRDVLKKEHLLKEGQLCTDQFFVNKGCLRMYFINEKGVEQITQFAIENWWMTDVMSFSRNTPSSFFIQAIEDSNISQLSIATEQELFEQVPAFETYMYTVQQYAYAAAQMRIKFLYDYSKEEHYKHFIKLYPQFAQRIPQYMLASFLGLTPEYLSELRKKNR